MEKVTLTPAQAAAYYWTQRFKHFSSFEGYHGYENIVECFAGYDDKKWHEFYVKLAEKIDFFVKSESIIYKDINKNINSKNYRLSEKYEERYLQGCDEGQHDLINFFVSEIIGKQLEDIKLFEIGHNSGIVVTDKTVYRLETSIWYRLGAEEETKFIKLPLEVDDDEIIRANKEYVKTLPYREYILEGLELLSKSYKEINKERFLKSCVAVLKKQTDIEKIDKNVYKLCNKILQEENVIEGNNLRYVSPHGEILLHNNNSFYSTIFSFPYVYRGGYYNVSEKIDYEYRDSIYREDPKNYELPF